MSSPFHKTLCCSGIMHGPSGKEHALRHRITAVVPLPETRLLLTFANGKRRVFDVSPYLDKDIFTQLRNPDYFAKVRAVSGHVERPNAQDFSPDTLYLRSVPATSGQGHAAA